MTVQLTQVVMQAADRVVALMIAMPLNVLAVIVLGMFMTI